MKQILTRVCSDLKAGKHLITYLAIMGSVVLFFVRVLGWFEPQPGKPDWTYKFQLLLWAVLLSELLSVKAAADALEAKIHGLNNSLDSLRTLAKPKGHLSALAGYPQDMAELILNRSQICVLAVTCSQIKLVDIDSYTKHLESGGSLKILTVKPNDAVFENVVYFGEDGNKVKEMKANHINMVDSLKHSWKNYIDEKRLEIRVLPHVPPYRLVIAQDKHKKRSVLWLPRPLRVVGRHFLACRLCEDDHSEWIDYLEKQFNALWAQAEIA